MTTGLSAPRKILAVVDDNDAQITLSSALALATCHGAEVQVLACLEPPHDMSILSRLSGEDAQALIEVAVERTRSRVQSQLASVAPGRDIALVVSVGKPYLEIIRHVAQSGCDFVVKRAEPLSGMDRFLFASTDQHLLRKCPCPVWLQTPSAAKQPRRILAAVDLDVLDADEPETLTDLNRRVVDVACTIAGASSAEVFVHHAWEAPGEGMVWMVSSGRGARLSAEKYVNEILSARQDAMDQFLLQFERGTPPSPRLTPRLIRGAPEQTIREQMRALNADLVVMGTVARTGLSGVFIGNTAENIINSLDCPVLAVKPDGFVSPLLRA